MIEFIKLYFTDMKTFVIGNIMFMMISLMIIVLRHMKESLK